MKKARLTPGYLQPPKIATTMQKKKLPKRPKQSAPLSSWERYEDKVNEVKRHNAAVEAAKKKKAALITKTKKMTAK